MEVTPTSISVSILLKFNFGQHLNQQLLFTAFNTKTDFNGDKTNSCQLTHADRRARNKARKVQTTTLQTARVRTVRLISTNRPILKGIHHSKRPLKLHKVSENNHFILQINKSNDSFLWVRRYARSQVLRHECWRSTALQRVRLNELTTYSFL